MLPQSTAPEPEPSPNASWWKKLLRYAAYALVVVVLGAAAWGLLWYWPRQAGEALPLLEDPTGELTLQDKLRRQVEVRQLEKDRVATGAQVFLGLGILVGIYLTWRRIRATEDQAEASLEQAKVANRNAKVAHRQAEIAQGQLELSRRQQTAERFTKAVEQLASPEMSIRLGGVYALEKIARDEPEEYFNLFREVLSAFVRESAQTSRGTDEDGGFIPPPTDLQAALTVLGRNPPPYVIDDPADIDWSGAHLEKANLRFAYLQSANLAGVYLEGASLYCARLGDADLSGSHLGGTDLFEAHLKGTSLYGAHLAGARRLDNAFIECIFFDDRTTFPDGVKLPEEQMVHFDSLAAEPDESPAESAPRPSRRRDGQHSSTS